MPRMTSWVSAYGYAATHDKCLADREEGRVRGLELGLTVVVALRVRGIGFVTVSRVDGRGRGRRAMITPCRSSASSAIARADAAVGAGERRDRPVEHVGEDLAPRRRARRAADERDLVDRVRR